MQTTTGTPLTDEPALAAGLDEERRMRLVDYVTVDVFTANRFGGNPLAVILDARGLGDEVLRGLASEFNYSEVVYLLPPSDPANTARVRIFTPRGEIPFAGHPNVGAAFVLGTLGSLFDRPVGDTMRFEEGAGVVDVELVRVHGALAGARVKAPQALEVRQTVEPLVIAACASLDPGDIVTEHHEPVLVSVGLPFAIAEVASLEALARACPNMAAFTVADVRHRSPEDRFSLFLYARKSLLASPLRARMFAPLSNVLEDPATGSASAALCAYLASLQPRSDLRGEVTIEQGEEMGRPSVIDVEVLKRGGTVSEVYIKGRCVMVMRGTIEI